MSTQSAKPALILSALPRPDRFFPNCGLSLVELVARARFGFPDIKKCWFGSTFVYRAADGNVGLRRNGLELDAELSLAGDAYGRALERLDHYYGITIRRERMSSLDQTLRAIEACLRQGVPAIASFDMAFLQGERRSKGIFRPHMIAVTGCDLDIGKLHVLEQVKGEVQIDLDDFAASFDRYEANGQAFSLLMCHCKAPGASLPLEQRAIAHDLRRCLDNLTSSDPNCGISALRRLQADVRRAHETLRRAFYIPGMWIFSHDRHCLRATLSHWRAAAPLAHSAIRALEHQLGRAFELWLLADMTVERGILEDDASCMPQIAALLDPLIALEQEIVESFRLIAAQLSDR